MSLSNEIMVIRQKAFLTQTQFAEQLQVSFATVNRWESGKTRPNLTAMRKMKQFCSDNNIEYYALEYAWLDSNLKKKGA